VPVTLSIKEVPEDVLERLRERAKRNHRSIQGELLTILEDAVAPRRLTVRELYERVRDSGLRTPSESTEIIRAERDARQGG
jgi:plasmid stability protein